MNITVIIPVHEYNTDVETMLSRAVKSVPSGINIRISCKSGLKEELKTYTDDKRIEIIENTANDKSDFATLVNQAVNGTEYFSILEFDDIYSNIWLDSFNEYLKYEDNASVYMYLEDLIDFNNGKFLGFGNEAPWAASFSEKVGYIDNESIKDYFDFYLTGAIFKTEDWVECGGLKPSIKLSFWYEFILRLLDNGKKIFVIPKVGYTHIVNRPNSLFSNYSTTMDKKESTWWYELAQQEHFFKNDRNKNYNEEGKA